MSAQRDGTIHRSMFGEARGPFADRFSAVQFTRRQFFLWTVSGHLLSQCNDLFRSANPTEGRERDDITLGTRRVSSHRSFRKSQRNQSLAQVRMPGDLPENGQSVETDTRGRIIEKIYQVTYSQLLTVGISDCILSADPSSVLATHALGSCIAVTIYDPAIHVAGLLHFMLPDSNLDPEKGRSRPFMFADTGIPMLFRSSYELGAVKQRLVVNIFGGAQTLNGSDTFNIGKRNHLSVRKILWKAGVMVHHEDVGGSLPRTVRVEVGSGRIIVSHGREQREVSQKGKDGGITNGI